MKPKVKGLDGAGKCADPVRVASVAAAHELKVLDADGIVAARALAVGLLGDVVASAESFSAVQAIFPASLLGHYEIGALTGVLAAFPLNMLGLEQIHAGAFDAVRLDAALIARPGEVPAAYYGWGFAATTKAGGRAVVKASADIHRELYFATPTFARATTPDGLRALTSIGFRPTPWGDACLLAIDANATGIGR